MKNSVGCCELCGVEQFTGNPITHDKECVWFPCGGAIITAKRKYDYSLEMEGIAGLLIMGELTYDEAEEICYKRYYNEDISCSMRMMDVIAELHGLVRKHARAVAPVYVEHTHGIIDKLIECVGERDTIINEYKRKERNESDS